MVTYAEILQNNPPVQLNYRLNSSIWQIEIIAKIINEIFFSLLSIIAAMHRGSRVPNWLFFMPASLKLSMHLADWNQELFKITIITTVCYKKIHSLCKHIRFVARRRPRVLGPGCTYTCVLLVKLIRLQNIILPDALFLYMGQPIKIWR